MICSEVNEWAIWIKNIFLDRKDKDGRKRKNWPPLPVWEESSEAPALPEVSANGQKCIRHWTGQSTAALPHASWHKLFCHTLFTVMSQFKCTNHHEWIHIFKNTLIQCFFFFYRQLPWKNMRCLIINNKVCKDAELLRYNRTFRDQRSNISKTQLSSNWCFLVPLTDILPFYTRARASNSRLPGQIWSASSFHSDRKSVQR